MTATKGTYPEAAPESAEDWCADVDRLMRAGELLAAFDAAMRGLDDYPGTLALQTRAILALCRADVSEHAEVLYRDWGLAHTADHDAMALAARIAKNRTRRLTGNERRDMYRRAGMAYRAVLERHGGHYPAVNAATMFLLAGDRDLAELMARRCLAMLDAENSQTPGEGTPGEGTPGEGTPGEGAKQSAAARYYQAASRAEAQLVLGDAAAAGRCVAEAAASGLADLSARAATRRQMRLICDAHGLPDILLAPLAPPPVAHFLGHRVFDDPRARFPAWLEAEMAAAVQAAVARVAPAAAVGSLAAGADILFAEALLDAGADVTVVLPAATETFAAVSVRPSGAEWERRYQRCLDRASRVVLAGDDDVLEHDSAFDYCSRVAMGLAQLQARHVDALPVQLALWDGHDLGQDVGTEADVRTWRATGCPGEVIRLPADAPSARARGLPAEPFEQRVMVMLFGDAVGFSRLGDRLIRRYHGEVTHTVATVLDRCAAVRDRNSWGDGLFVVFDDVAAAADCALAIQESIRAAQADGSGAEPTFRLRMSLHAGPVFAYDDPIRKLRSYGGRHVTRAARIEPIAPLGEVVVTEPVAALLALEAPQSFLCEYVGHQDRAKGSGSERMFLLRRLMP